MKILEVKKSENILPERSVEGDENIRESVLEILGAVKTRGDEALFELTEKFDGAKLENLRVDSVELEEALNSVGEDLLRIYETAAENIKDFHEHQKEESWSYPARDGVTLGQKITPIERVGIYVPGGKAAYPSTVLMDAIPAIVAGVESIAMVTPPDKDGKIDPHILAAAHIAGVDEIYKLGGAQAVAALAYGTETIEPVRKIVGPGNIFVATAKREVFGTVDIDMIAGPSEVLIIADNTANPKYIAADLLAQAEHDEMAMPILITPKRELAEEVEREVLRQLGEDISRTEIARASVDNYGRIFIVDDLDEAVRLSNEIAPEHLELLVEDPDELIKKVKNAGAIFKGAYTPEPVGDYFAGPNHTLPTSGTAKFSSPLGVYDFQKRSSVLEYDREALLRIGEDVMRFAQSEGLDAHANSVNKRLGDDNA